MSAINRDFIVKNGLIVQSSNSSTITTSAASSIGLIVKGSASQTADLQQWQNNSGGILSSVNSSGTFIGSNGFRVPNGSPYQGVRSTGSAVVNMMSFASGTDRIDFGGGTSSGDIFVFYTSGAIPRFRINNSGQVLGDANAAPSFGGGAGVIFIGSATTVPTTNPTGGGVLYVEAGALKYRGSSGIGVQLESYAVGDKPLIVKGFASQTANLQEWQDSTGAVQSWITPTGSIQLLSGGTTRPIGWNTGAAARATINTNNNADITFAVGANSTLMTLGAVGGVAGTATIQTATTTSTVLIVKGAASQTADLQQWQNSAGSIVGGVTAGGSMYIARGTAFAANAFGVSTGATTNIGVIVRGEASQTANLQEWQNSSAVAVASLSPAGLFTAVSKSFDIQHPTKPDMRLRYGSLEGPENGVYVRGNTKENIIELPEVWTGLVDESTITVSLTSVGKFQKVYVEKIEGNKIYIGGRVKEISYVVFGERKDIDKITVEY